LDSLDIKKVVLVGHSVGGDEMTKFACLFPERVDGLIYLEAASDKLATRDSLARYPDPESTLPEPTENDLASVSAYREYYARVNGVKLPVTEFRAICEWEPDGRFKGWITPGWVYQAIIDRLEHPDYSGILSPSLAIYGVSYPITELFIDYDERDSVTQSIMKTRYEAGKRLEEMSRDLFRKQSRNGTVVEIPGAGHSLYITHADQVETAMRKFLRKPE
jgi:pimeloyl-ACP methyl ester carboxylesterase